MLRFYGPVNPMGSCRARSVYLTTRLLGRLSPLSQYCAHSFARNWQLPFLNQRKGENDRRKYFMINLHERMLPTSAGVEPATSWSPVGRRIQLSHRGRLLSILVIVSTKFYISQSPHRTTWCERPTQSRTVRRPHYGRLKRTLYLHLSPPSYMYPTCNMKIGLA